MCTVFIQHEEIILQKLEAFCRNLFQDGNHFRCLVHNDNVEFCVMIKGMQNPHLMQNPLLVLFKQPY